MKTIKRKSGFVIKLLVIVAMLFSALAVTAFATTDGVGGGDASEHQHEMRNEPAVVCSLGVHGHDAYEVCNTCGESTYDEAQHLHTWTAIDDPTDGFQKHYYCEKCDVYIAKFTNGETGNVDKTFGDGLVITGPEADKFTASNVTDTYENYEFKETQFGKHNKGAVVLAYDFNPNGATGAYTVKLEVPTDYIGNRGLYVYHVTEDGSWELVSHEVVNGWVIFEADDFSVYALVNVEEQFNWMKALIIALSAVLAVVIIVVAIVVIVKKKKKKAALAEQTVAEAPVVEATVEETPVVEEAPAVEETPVVEAAVEETPAAEEAPVVEAAVEETPVVEEAPAVEEAPVVEATVEETPAVEETLVAEEAPVVEATVEETPVVEEAPVVEAPKTPVVVVETEDEATDSIVVDGEVVYVHYRSSFTSRLIQAPEKLKDYYNAIKNCILSYTGVKAKSSWNYEIFTKGRTQCVKLNVKGKALTVNLALDPKAYSVTKYHFTDLSDNPKYAPLPMLLKVKSDRGLKYALELIAEVMSKLDITKAEEPTVDYRMPYESNASLAKRGLVKVILPAGVNYDPTVEIREANVSAIIDSDDENTAAREEVFVYDDADNETAEPTVAEDTAEAAPAVAEESIEENVTVTEKASSTVGMPVISADDTIIVDGNVVLIRYRSSFTSRLIQSDSDVQDYYTALKNHLLSYKGVKARTSWNYETFAKGRTQCARINIKGKTLTINLALLPEAYNVNKYHFTDLSDNPKFDKLPMLLKIRSARALKYALELIDELMKTLDVPQGKAQDVDYRKPYESNIELARRGLMKIILPAGVALDEKTLLGDENAEASAETVAEDAPLVIEEPIYTDAEHADEMINDYVAERSIKIIKKKRPTSGKMAEVNIDDICANFENGDVVTLEALKEKLLVSQSAGKVKILANGVMTKSLTVEADKFSLQAVKMITLAGGTAKRYD